MAGKKTLLILEDGTHFYGTNFGADGEYFGEIVFNTSMTGYQEILTDPSYKGQMVILTYPLIGNYGINPEDEESGAPKVEGLIIRELSGIASNHRSRETLSNYLKRHDIMGIEGIDTRALVLHIREKGAMRAALSTVDLSTDSLLEKTLASPLMLGRDLIGEVTIDRAYEYTPRSALPEFTHKPHYRVVVFDYGIKRNILEMLSGVGLHAYVVPATTTADEVRRMNPDGVFLSNGPGDPAALPYIIKELKEIVPAYPTFGICLGHQLLGITFGGTTFKLKFGHRGANHPVIDTSTQKIEITSQNHGFAVDPESLPEDVEVTHWNLNDRTVEGLRHKTLPVFSVQYHPEASPGPHDASYLFMRSRKFIEERKAHEKEESNA